MDPIANPLDIEAGLDLVTEASAPVAIAIANQADLELVFEALPAWLQPSVSAFPLEDESFLLYVPEEHAAFVQALVDDLPRARKLMLKAYLAQRRSVVEAGGIVVGTTTLLTDAASQCRIVNAHTLAQLSAAALFDFRAASGWVSVTAAELAALAAAVGEHLRACDALERQLWADIDLGTIDSKGDIDAAAWPATAGAA